MACSFFTLPVLYVAAALHKNLIVGHGQVFHPARNHDELTDTTPLQSGSLASGASPMPTTRRPRAVDERRGEEDVADDSFVLHSQQRQRSAQVALAVGPRGRPQQPARTPAR